MTTKGKLTMNAIGERKAARQNAQRGLVLAALLAGVLFATGISRAQSSADSALSPAAKSVAMPAKAPVQQRAGGQREGIKVHGHWTIDVRDPDGKLVSHTDFENSLCVGQSGNGGDYVLTNLLFGQIATGGWLVGLGNPTLPSPSQTNPPPPCGLEGTLGNSAVQSAVFVLSQSNSEFSTNGGCAASSSPLCFPNLSFSMNAADNGIILSGSFTVPTSLSTTTITAVGTAIAVCPNSQTQPECLHYAAAGDSMTATYLTGVSPSPLAPTVSAGQSVSVTVTISFTGS